MTYAFLRSLLTESEAFEQSAGHSPADLAAFGQWLVARASPEGTSPREAPPELRRLEPNPYETPESEISTLLTFLYRYVRSYARLGLENSPLTTFDDFTYLATLLGAEPGRLTKSELTERNIQEKATGVEVIRRLLKQGFITEEPHPTDKRAKHLLLTPTGRGVLFDSFRRMGQVAALGSGPLAPDEKQQLLRLLRKLDHFHHPLFVAGAGRGDTLEALVARHLPPPA